MPAFTSTPASRRDAVAGLAGAPHLGTHDVGLHPQVTAPGRPGEPVEIPGQRQPGQGVGPGDGRPVRQLVLPTDAPLEVDPPRAGRRPHRSASARKGMAISAVQPSATRLVRTRHTASQLVLISRPSLATCQSARAPAGVGEEDVPVPAVEEGVEDDAEAVLLGIGEVLLDVGDDQPVGLGVVHVRADVEVVGVVGDAHLRLLGGGPPFAGLRLGEAGDGSRAAPHLVVQDRRRHGLPPWPGPRRCEAAGRRCARLRPGRGGTVR